MGAETASHLVAMSKLPQMIKNGNLILSQSMTKELGCS